MVAGLKRENFMDLTLLRLPLVIIMALGFVAILVSCFLKTTSQKKESLKKTAFWLGAATVGISFLFLALTYR
jgi:multidrug transporter EmrE-like cation transporter